MLCFLTTSRRDPDGAASLVFHGSSEFAPVVCAAELSDACPFRVSPSKAPLAPCACCGGRHRQGSGSERACVAWHGYKELLRVTKGQGRAQGGTSLPCYAAGSPAWIPRALWPRVKASILRRDGYRCRDCGLEFRDASGRRERGALEVHHILPRSRGGSDHPLNLITLCKACHGGYTSESASDLAMETRHERQVLGNRALLRWSDGTQEWEEE
jgi:5-methylcytosine-specific restriction protein A